MFVAVPLQIKEAAGVAVITGVGFTVTTAVALAVQVFEVPMIVYVAVPAVVVLLLLNVCAMVVPLSELPPLIPEP